MNGGTFEVQGDGFRCLIVSEFFNRIADRFGKRNGIITCLIIPWWITRIYGVFHRLDSWIELREDKTEKATGIPASLEWQFRFCGARYIVEQVRRGYLPELALALLGIEDDDQPMYDGPSLPPLAPRRKIG